MVVLLLAALLGGCAAAPAAAPPSPPPAMSDSTLTLFDFEGPQPPDGRIVNDGVMGGRSQGAAEVANGALVFTGTLVTQGGGFTSVRLPTRVDLSGYDGVELRVRGGGRTFELDVDDGSRLRGRSVSRRATFPSTSDWQTVRIPFASLETSVFGRSVRVEAIDPARVESLAVFIADGQDGPFRLEVDAIRAYRDA